MNKDYENLKKKYGERFAKLCRSLFPSIIEEGVLYNIISNCFEPSKFLYDDIMANTFAVTDDNDEVIGYTNNINAFKNYIYSFVKTEKAIRDDTVESPEDLMYKAGYTLFKCENHDDILKFKKYYTYKETLCTFDDANRINNYNIFFAVKKNVDEIKRENFKNPQRQDEYGTSVICLQFYKDKNSFLSIKNRYNHTVENPDATFSNDLENIYTGLTDSFYKYYGINLDTGRINFELPNYIQDENGKMFRYNYEINNIYYCPGNVIIHNGKPEYFDKGRYEVFDYFILDKKEKTLKCLNDVKYGFFSEPFLQYHKNINKIDVNVINKDGDRRITLSMADGSAANIVVNKFNQMIEYQNDYITVIGQNFLKKNLYLKNFSAKSAIDVGINFMYDNTKLEILNLPLVKNIGASFLNCNNNLKSINLPSAKYIGSDFLFFNSEITNINIPNVISIKNYFMPHSQISEFKAENLKTIGDAFLLNNSNINKVILPSVESIGSYCLCNNIQLNTFEAEKLKQVGSSFLSANEQMHKFYAPNLQSIGSSFLYSNYSIDEFCSEKINNASSLFFMNNNKLRIKLENMIRTNFNLNNNIR